MSKSNDSTTENLWDYDYFSNHYKVIAIDLSKQSELENSDLKQQTNFIGRLDENNGTTMFVINEKSEETTFEFSQNTVSVVWFSLFWIIYKMETQKIVNLLNDTIINLQNLPQKNGMLFMIKMV